MNRMLGWVVVVVTAIFVVLNLQRTQVRFFGFLVEMPVAFVVIFSASLGALATWAFSSLKGRK